MPSPPAALAVSAVGQLLSIQPYVRMKSIAIVGACAVAAVAMATALTSASYASSSDFERALLTPFSAPAPTTLASGGSLFDKEVAVLMGQGLPPARAMRALHVQGTIAQTDIVSKVEAAMGSAFGGVWFEPAAAQLHIGVTSPASRRAAEEVIAREGVAADVVVTPVRSTSAQLVAVQNQWDRKLAHLFARAQVETGLEPQRNAVVVTLSSSVPAPERAALEREASAAKANVFVTVAANSQLRATPDVKTACKTWEPNKAYCDPSITPGVRIVRPEEEISKGAGESHENTTLDNFEIKTLENVRVGDEVSGTGIAVETTVTAKPTKTSVTISAAASNKGVFTYTFTTGAVCSAGPVAIPKKNRKERVLLTAGHCIEGGHGVGSKWEALNREPKASPIGPAENFTFGGKAGAKRGDYGDILIEPAPGKWQTGKPNDPVLAVTAEWKKMNAKGEETSYPVKGERKPAVGMTSCHDGQTSGESCGEITKLNQMANFGENNVVEGLVEVREPKEPKERLISEGGDSGGPWLFIEEPSQEALMEGTNTGRLEPECKKVVKQKGRQFFKTEKECLELKFEEKEGNEGEWERKNRVIYQPLKQPMAGATEGSLDALELELLTTANEIIPAHQWIVNGIEVAPGEKIEVQGNLVPGGTQLEGTILGLNVHITCQTAIVPSGSANILETGGKAKFKIEYTGCAVVQVNSKGFSEPLPSCKIEKEPIVAEGEGELKEAGILTLKEIGAGPFEKFSIVKTNKEAACAAESKLEVKGTQVCTLPHYAVAALVGVVECNPSGSALTIAKEPTRFYSKFGIAVAKGGTLRSN